MAGELGKASLDLEANLGTFERNVLSAEKRADELEKTLEALAAVSKVAEAELNRVKMSTGQSTESKVSAEGILAGVRGISDEARTAARELDKVRITEAQAAESDAAGDVIDRKLKDINGNANEARRSLDRVRLRLAGMGGVGGGGSGGGRAGVGVGPFGSGYGRIGVFGAAVGLGALTAPAAGPAAAGLLAAIPTLAAGGAGALGTLVLAFQGVGKAIGGDKQAFDDLGPSAQKFVQTVRSLDGWLDKLKETAAGSMFPGLTDALHSALSPGTLSAITVAVRQFGAAIGSAGAQWGKYFGSAEFQQIFGPLMASGARSIGVLSDAVLHLFNAFGVLGRAAIPFTSWLMHAADAGAKFVDNWIKAKDTTGALGHALDEAKVSLALVARLAQALVNAVVSLGIALYPVAKIAVKDLTDGLNALAGIFDRNKQTIRDMVSGALGALVSTVRIAVPILRELFTVIGDITRGMIGWKGAFEIVISGFLALQFAKLAGRVGGLWTALDGIGPRLAKVGAAETVVGTEAAAAEVEVTGLRGALLGLGAPEVLAAIAAAAAAYLAFKAITNTVGATGPVEIGPSTLAGVAKRDRGRIAGIKGSRLTLADKVIALQKKGLTDWQIKQQLEKGYSGDSGRDLVVNQALEDALLLTKYAYGPQQLTLPSSIQHQLAAASNLTGSKATAAQKSAYAAAIAYYDKLLKQPGETQSQKTAILQQRAQWVQALAALSSGGAFSTPPAFTKNVGSTASTAGAIPPAAAHAEALASANASKAGVLGNVGATAKRYLDAELADLQTADRLIKAKYESATGKARTQLFAALTSVENKIRTVRKELGKAITDSRGADLQFAVDQAKEAVAAATEGTSAYDKAVAAEEKALKAQIAYMDARSKNSKLSLAARTKALRAETADENALKALLKQSAVNAGANEAQFFSSFKDIVTAFAPNVFPVPGGGGKTDTHLHDIKNELRQQTPLLKDAVRRGKFPATQFALGSASAVAG